MDAFFAYLSTFQAFLLLALGFGFVIFIHELGHFLAAKFTGIKVTQFAIGFGQALLSYRKGMGLSVGSTEPRYFGDIVKHINKQRGEGKPKVKLEDLEEIKNVTEAEINDAAKALGYAETEYRFNWMPLGGYVKMLGQEDLDPEAMSEDPRSFNKASFGARALVISAGVVMNLISGAIIFAIAFMHGIPFPSARVGLVEPGSPAALAYPIEYENDPAYQGIRPGDLPIKIYDTDINDFLDVKINVALAPPNDTIPIVVKRGDELLTYHVKPAISEDGPTAGLQYIGLAPAQSNQLYDAKVMKSAGVELDEKLKKAGVEPGMQLVAVEGQPVELMHEITQALQSRRGQEITFTFKNKTGKVAEVQLQPGLAWLSKPKTREPYAPDLQLIPLVEVANTLENSPAEKAGVKKGDIIIRAGSIAFPNLIQVQNQIKSAPGKPTTIVVERDGKQESFDITPGADGLIGLSMAAASDTNRFHSLEMKSFQQALNLPAGSAITKINGQPVDSLYDLQRILQDIAQKHTSNQTDSSDKQNAGEEEISGNAESSNMAAAPVKVMVTYVPAIGKTFQSQTTAVTLLEEDLKKLSQAKWALPAELPVNLFKPEEVMVQRSNPIAAMALGIEKTHVYMVQTYITIARLFQQSVGVEHLRGPIGIAYEGTRITEEKGWPWLLFFLGLISANLAVLNFLPMPIVDGGLMVFLIIEKIKGSPVNPKVMNAVNLVGLALLATLFLVITYNDGARLINTVFGG